MVLGFGSRNKKERSSSSSSSAQAPKDHHLVHLHIQEIKPWHSGLQSSKTSPLILRWSCGDKLIGSSKGILPTSTAGVAGQAAAEALVFNETFQVPASLNGSRAKKSDAIVFSLLEASNLKGQPLAQAILDLQAAFASSSSNKTLTIPLTVPKKLAPNSSSKIAVNSFMHITVLLQQDDRVLSSRYGDDGRMSPANIDSGRTSNASSVIPPLDEETQQLFAEEDANIFVETTELEIPGTAEQLVLSADTSFLSHTFPSEPASLDNTTLYTTSTTIKSASSNGPVKGAIVANCDNSTKDHKGVDTPTDRIPNARNELTKVYGSANFLVAGIINDDIVEEPAKTEDEPELASDLTRPLLKSLSNSVTCNTVQTNEVPKLSRNQLSRSPRVSLRDTGNATDTGLIKQTLKDEEEKLIYDKNQRQGIKSGEEVTAEEKVQGLETRLEKLEGELRDVAAVEAALYSVVAEHGSSSLRVHSPARRLSRVYIHACKHGSGERRASCARNTVAGLILVARACGNDVPRLTFWWSNTTVLRETISMACDVPALFLNMGAVNEHSQPETLQFVGTQLCRHQKESHMTSCKVMPEDWTKPITLTAALERVEAWIYTKVVESVWWQVLTPYMQHPVDANLHGSPRADARGRDMSICKRRNDNKSIVLELGGRKQGSTSAEIWKKAFSDAYRRLCPVRAVNIECGCLPMLIRMVMEECVVKLDIAMFNAILRGNPNQTPIDPFSDPISDYRVLPIPTGSLSFGIGAQLKNVIGTLSEWFVNLLNKDTDTSRVGYVVEDNDKSSYLFPFLKALGDLLMLPKQPLMDKSLRKEVCPTLSLPFIGKILLNFQPDEFSPEPVTPELIKSIDSEISAASRMQTESDGASLQVVRAPATVYSPPQSGMVRQWIGDPTGHIRFGRSNCSLLRKGHTSDDEIDELESPFTWLLENTTTGLISAGGCSALTDDYSNNGCIHGRLSDASDASKSGMNCRFHLLREVWNTS